MTYLNIVVLAALHERKEDDAVEDDGDHGQGDQGRVEDARRVDRVVR